MQAGVAGDLRHAQARPVRGERGEDPDRSRERRLSGGCPRHVDSVSVLGEQNHRLVSSIEKLVAESKKAAPGCTVTVSLPALICAEIYRRQGTWRLRAVGQGYSDGLAGLSRAYGVNVY